MPFCYKCGRELEEQARFCPDCGTPNVKAATAGQPAGPAAPPPVGDNPLPRRGGRKSLIAIIGGTAAVVVIVAALLISGVFASPAQKFLRVQEEFILDSALEVVGSCLDILEQPDDIALDLTLSAESMNYEVGQYLDGTELGLQVNAGNGRTELAFDLQLMGGLFLSGYGCYSEKDSTAGIYIPELDDEYYMFDVFQFLRTYTDAGISEEDGPQIDAKLTKTLLDRYLDILLSVVTTESVQEERGQTARLLGLGKSVFDCKLYTFVPLAEDVEEMLLTLADTLEEDDELRDYVISLAASAAALSGDSRWEIAADYEDTLEELCRNLRENARDDAHSAEELTWQVYVRDGMVCKQAIGIDGNSLVIYEAYGDKKDFEAILYSGEYDTADMAFGFSRKADGEALSGELRLFAPYDSSMAYSFRYDVDTSKKSALNIPYGSYQLDLMGLRLGMEVRRADGGGTDHSITLRAGEEAQWQFYSLYEMINGTGISEVTLHTTDKKPDIKVPDREPVDITNYSEYELYDILERAGYEFQGLIDGFFW